MTPMTSAEKVKAYRQRQKVISLADEYFDGQMQVSLEEFREVINDWWDENYFNEQLVGLVEMSEEYNEERNEVWSNAYDEAYNEEYNNHLQENTTPDMDEGDLADAEYAAKEYAEDAAKEEADLAVAEWQEGLEPGYGEVYYLYDLVDVYHNTVKLI